MRITSQMLAANQLKAGIEPSSNDFAWLHSEWWQWQPYKPAFQKNWYSTSSLTKEITVKTLNKEYLKMIED